MTCSPWTQRNIAQFSVYYNVNTLIDAMRNYKAIEEDLFHKSITKNTINSFTQKPAATDSKLEAFKADCIFTLNSIRPKQRV